MKALRCPIDSIEYYNYDTRRVFLTIPDGATLDFKAGQYLEMHLSNKTCPFSIASSPSLAGKIELHVRPTPDSEDSVEIEQLLDKAEFIDIEAPLGDCFLEQAPAGPLLLLAASTGITQMKSIIETILPGGLRQPVYLYWGVLSDRDLYLNELCESWASRDRNFHYIPVVSDPATSPGWTGKKGLVGNVALEDFNDVSDIIVYVSGGPGMVYATLDMFVDRGMPAENMHSDIFSYAPRKASVN